MKKMSVVKLLALFLGLNCLGPAWVNAAPAHPYPHQYDPFPQPSPSIQGTWEGEGTLLAKTISDGVRNINTNVKLTIDAQPAEITFPHAGPGPLFHGQMEISFKDPNYLNSGGGIVGLSEVLSFNFEVAGHISASGDLTITGVTNNYDWPWYPPSLKPDNARPKTTLLKQEGAASLVSGKPRSIRGDFRVAVQGMDFYSDMPNGPTGDPSAEPYLVSSAFAGTFNVQETLAK
jgi:hypothetical protein